MAPKVEKLKILDAKVNSLSRSQTSINDDVRSVNSELSRLRAERDNSKPTDPKLTPLLAQISELEERLKSLLQARENVQHAWNETMRLRDSCKQWLRDRGFAVPDVQDWRAANL